MPSTCAACTITITSGVTLTIDESVTCQNCTFPGGAIVMNNFTLNIQYFGGSPVTTTFNNVNFQIKGNSGKVIVNAPLSLSGSTFTFNDGSYFNTSYQVDLASSTVNLYDAATMSGIALGNVNNVYYNWSNYNAGASKAPGTNKSYSTSSSTLNCGGSGQHSCSNPSLYGPSTLTTAGVTPGTTLPVILTEFSAVAGNDGTAVLNWETKMEENSSRFEIERSTDGTSWGTIGSVAAKGNSSLSTGYTYTDLSPVTCANYYRLKMNDLDESAVYSEVKVLQGAASVSKVSFFPILRGM